MTLRAVCYARVSSQSQRERDTIASQLRVLPDFVERQGWRLVRPATTYVDDGRTAKAGHLDARTGLAALLKDAAAGAFDVVAVVDLDRLTRSEDIAERGAILGAFQRAGVRVASATSGQVLDLSTSVGDLFSSLQTFFAAEENRKRRERIVQGKITAIARGRKPAGPTPYGLHYDRASGAWSVDPDEGPVVVEAFERVAGGESCLAIAHDFEVRGLPAPRRHWTRHFVWAVITNRYPIGEWTADRRRRLTIPVPPIVSDELWLRAQDALAATGRRGLKRTKHVYLLEGLAVCGKCGHPIAIRSATTNPKRTNGNPSPAAYVCRARKLDLPGVTRCDLPVQRCSEVDDRLWAAVSRELEQPELVEQIIAKRLDSLDNPRDWEADAAGYRRHLERLDRAERIALERSRRGLVSEEALDAELEAIVRERSAVRAQLATAERARSKVEAVRSEVADGAQTLMRLSRALPTMTPAKRREVITLLISKGGVTFGADGRVAVKLLLPFEPARTVPELGALCSTTPREDHETCFVIRTVA